MPLIPSLLDIWPDANWPEHPVPENASVWGQAINDFEKELEEIIEIVHHRDTQLLEVYDNGKTLSWAAMTVIHHNGYRMGQINAIGRQLGVW